MIEKTIHRTILYATALIGLLLGVSSCQDEDIADNRDNGRITFFVTEKAQSDNGEWMEGNATTKQQKAPHPSIIEVGDMQLSLQLSCEKNTIELHDDTVTRGAALDNTNHLITQIYATAIKNSGNGGVNYFENEAVSIDNYHGNSTHFWPDGKLSFFAHACSKENVTIAPYFTREDGACRGAFDYTLPAATTGATKTDATHQPDVVFAISPDLTHEMSPNVDLIFHHALSAISFKVGKMPENVYLKSITLSGVYPSGHCQMNNTGTNNINFVWSYSGVSQTSSYTEDVKQPATQGAMMGNEETVFMMIPQAMSDHTKFTLTFAINGHEYTLEKKFNTIITSWDADMKYIFTIGLPEEIDVEIDDQVSGLKKSNVTIQNTGITTGYIRAAIVGNWKNATGDPCDLWKESDGTFSYGSQWNNYWKKGGDGFYYYLHPVARNEYTYPLFDTYTLSAGVVENHINQSLEIDLAVQIIPVEYKSVWPELNNI